MNVNNNDNNTNSYYVDAFGNFENSRSSELLGTAEPSLAEQDVQLELDVFVESSAAALVGDSPFGTLPVELHQRVSDMLELPQVMVLSCVSHYFHRVFANAVLIARVTSTNHPDRDRSRFFSTALRHVTKPRFLQRARFPLSNVELAIPRSLSLHVFTVKVRSQVPLSRVHSILIRQDRRHITEDDDACVQAFITSFCLLRLNSLRHLMLENIPYTRETCELLCFHLLSTPFREDLLLSQPFQTSTCCVTIDLYRSAVAIPSFTDRFILHCGPSYPPFPFCQPILALPLRTLDYV
jgi:hypothetical protein